MTHTTQSKADLAYAAAHNVHRQMARTADGTYFVLLPAGFDLEDDYKNHNTHEVDFCTMTGRYTGKAGYVWIDHNATGTGTAGTGDTVVRLID